MIEIITLFTWSNWAYSYILNNQNKLFQESFFTANLRSSTYISVGMVCHRFQFWLQQKDCKYCLHVDLQCKLVTSTFTFVWFQVLRLLIEFIVNLCFLEYCDVMKVLFLIDGIGYRCKLDVFYLECGLFKCLPCCTFIPLFP